MTVAAGQSFEVHGSGQMLHELEAEREVLADLQMLHEVEAEREVLADLQLAGESGGGVALQSGGDATLLRVEISSGTVTFSSSLN